MKTPFICLAGITAFAGSASTHHSHAYYAPDEEIVLDGTVTEFD